MLRILLHLNILSFIGCVGLLDLGELSMDQIISLLLIGHAILDSGHTSIGIGQFGPFGLELLHESLLLLGRVPLYVCMYGIDLTQYILLTTNLHILTHKRLCSGMN